MCTVVQDGAGMRRAENVQWIIRMGHPSIHPIPHTLLSHPCHNPFGLCPMEFKVSLHRQKVSYPTIISPSPSHRHLTIPIPIDHRHPHCHPSPSPSPSALAIANAIAIAIPPWAMGESPSRPGRRRVPYTRVSKLHECVKRRERRHGVSEARLPLGRAGLYGGLSDLR